MKRNDALKAINPVLGLVFLSQAITGMLHTPIQAALSFERWEIWHGAGGLVLVILVVTHLILNWNWIRASYLRK